MPVPVIDLFAGPGGLGEGFSSTPGIGNEPAFDVELSIEKDEIAHRTLTLRAFVRAFGYHAPDCYYDFIRGSISREQLFERHDVQGHLELARRQAVRAELGKTPHNVVDGLIRAVLRGRTEWVLIGGPPCQAYSLAGRSRRRNEDQQAFEADEKHFLYREYLRVLKEHSPSVFVMENVKGMLSSTHSGELIFEKIMKDLRCPGDDATYEIVSLVSDKQAVHLKPKDFIVASEHYGVPQARHRVILLGIRNDVRRPGVRPVLSTSQPVTVSQSLRGMPALRSRLSRQRDSADRWLAALKRTKNRFTHWKHEQRKEIENMVRTSCGEAGDHEGTGAAFMHAGTGRGSLNELHRWLFDSRIGGVIQHQSRSHMASDLERYMFAASYARVVGSSPQLSDFPPDLLPRHANVDDDEVPFNDRFRVQLGSRPSTTVVSHIAKDGHYYIHPDPSQCRSLTVREAARLQTFPDNYFFEGNRTDQYHQVGNAVPPLLARQIAEVVGTIMRGPVDD